MCAIVEWEANTTYAMVYSVTDEGDLPMVGMNTNACEHIQCPIQKEIKQTYAYTLPLSKKFPLVCTSDDFWSIDTLYLDLFNFWIMKFE